MKIKISGISINNHDLLQPALGVGGLCGCFEWKNETSGSINIQDALDAGVAQDEIDPMIFKLVESGFTISLKEG